VRWLIRASIIGVTGVAIILFGVPLALALQSVSHGQAVHQLVADATRSGTDVSADFVRSGDPIELAPAADGAALALYGSDGRRASGQGPGYGDQVVRSALAGRVSDGSTGGAIVVAVPLSNQERVFAVMRASLPASAVEGSVHRDWVGMGVLGLVALVLAGFIAHLLAIQLSRPVEALVAAATRLGEGDFSVRPGRSRVPELDTAARALEATADRLGTALSRERSFSTHASHQLRTPLAALRVRLETAQITPGADLPRAVSDALDQVDRLDATVKDLLLLARDRKPSHAPLPVPALLDDLEQEWRGRLAVQARPLRVIADDDQPVVRASTPAVRQILNVLIDNAQVHGRGAVTLHARRAGSGLVIAVEDEGLGVEGEAERIFHRHPGDPVAGGIGLPLARSLAEAEGGRLLLRAPGPRPRFELFLPSVSDLA
jgi:signal transduction histidine kinase